MRHLDSESQGATNLYTTLKSMTPEPPEGPAAGSSDESGRQGCRVAARIMFLFVLALTVITIVEAVMRAQG